MTDSRPTKKQRELLSFIDNFIKGNGYGPSYREVMRALDYKSVSTVATHVDGLIARGFLRKTDHSARSLQVIGTEVTAVNVDNAHLAWLRGEIKQRTDKNNPELAADIEILQSALNILDPPHEKQV